MSRSLLQQGTMLTPPESSTFAVLQTDRGREYLDTKRHIALREWFRALGSRNSAPAVLMGIGDSISEGKGGTSYLTRWTRAVAPALRTAFPTTGAAGSPMGYIEGATSFSPTFSDFPVAYSGTWSRDTVNPKGIGQTSINISSGGAVTLTVSNATSVDIFYYKASGTRTFSWYVDSGTATSVNDGGVSTVADFFSIRATIPDLGTHTVTVTSTAGAIGFSGWYVYNGDESKGIKVLANGLSGSPSQSYINTATYLGQQVAAIQPNAFLIELGANDYQNGTPIMASAFKANLQSIIANVRANCNRPPSIILMPVWRWSPGVPPVDTWANFLNAMYGLAASDDDICIFDGQQRMGLQTTSDPCRNLLSSDNIHPSDAGQFMIAQSLARFLSPS